MLCVLFFGFCLWAFPAQTAGAQAAAKTKTQASAVPVAKSDLRILFVGNSYTYFNNLPMMVTQVANSAKAEPFHFVADMYVGKAEAKLRDLAQDDALLQKIAQGAYHIVVIQEQGLVPLYDDERRESQKAMETLAEHVYKSKASLVIFGTWARKQGDRVYKEKVYSNFSPPRSPEEMTLRLNEYYKKMAVELEAVYVPVGMYWYGAQRRFPEIELFAANGTQPSKAGSYLAALGFYKMLSNTGVEKTEYVPPAMDLVVARKLRSLFKSEK